MIIFNKKLDVFGKNIVNFSKLRYEELSEVNDICVNWERDRAHYKITADVSIGEESFNINFGSCKELCEGKRGSWKSNIWKRLMCSRSLLLELVALHQTARRADPQLTPTFYAKLFEIQHRLAQVLSNQTPGYLLQRIVSSEPLLMDYNRVDSPIWIMRCECVYENIYFSILFWKHPSSYLFTTPSLNGLTNMENRGGHYLTYVKLEPTLKNGADILSLEFVRGGMQFYIIFTCSKEMRLAVGSSESADDWVREVMQRVMDHPDCLFALWPQIYCLSSDVIRQVQENRFEMLSDFRVHRLNKSTLENIEALGQRVLEKSLLPEGALPRIVNQYEMESWTSDSLMPPVEHNKGEKLGFFFHREIGELFLSIAITVPLPLEGNREY